MLTEEERREMGKKLYDDDLEKQFKITEPFQNANDQICRICGKRRGEHFGLECPKDFLLKEKPDKANVFVKHIQNHLKEGQVVICKICNKDIDTIYKEEGETK